jgi:ribosomal protein S18 acetylase RimI-like enzyme
MSEHAGSDRITTRIVRSVDAELAEGIDRLVSQVSSSGATPGRWEFDQMLADGGVVIIVAEMADIVVGLIALAVFRTPTGVHAKIEDLIVDDEAHGRGVAESLARRALRTAASRGARFITVQCPESKPALGRIYERLGFERQGTTSYVVTLSG